METQEEQNGDELRFCIKIETKDTYELFNSIEQAFMYLRDNPKSVLSLVYTNNTYMENGVLNYEDKSDTIIKQLWGNGFKRDI